MELRKIQSGTNHLVHILYILILIFTPICQPQEEVSSHLSPPSPPTQRNRVLSSSAQRNGSLWAPSPPSTLLPLLSSTDEDEEEEEETSSFKEETPPPLPLSLPVPISSIRHHKSHRHFVRKVPRAAGNDPNEGQSSKDQVYGSVVHFPEGDIIRDSLRLLADQSSGGAPARRNKSSSSRKARGEGKKKKGRGRKTTPIPESLFPQNINEDVDNEHVEMHEEEEEDDQAKNSLFEADRVDAITEFLRKIETQHLLGNNCTPGTDLRLPEGVVARYAQEKFRLEGEVAVNRANWLTRLWKFVDPRVLESEYLLHANLVSMLEFDEDIFAAGNCYDKYEYKSYNLFCPWGYRLETGEIYVKDLAVEYNYLGNTSEFFYIARMNAERVISNYSQFTRGYNSYTYNATTHTERVKEEILRVGYEDGKWSKPYFDCGGGDIWMMTYTVPFFGFRNNKYFFKGTSGIDIDLRRVDIDQCPSKNSSEINIFADSDKCKKDTTKCVPVPGLGFRRGSYRCECRLGWYFPNVSSTIKYFNGNILEEEYEKMIMLEENIYNLTDSFKCLQCADGCDSCIDDRPCMVSLNWFMRTAILILQTAIIGLLPIVGVFTWKYSNVKVVRAASPVLLRFIVLGAFFIYTTTLVMYPSPSVFTCTIRVWLREIGFSLAYGALMLKTWRISVIFRVRSAKAVIITDLDLMKRLGIIVAIFTALLVIRTLVAPPFAKISYTSDNLKAWMCTSDWWDHSFTIMELSLLVWGIRLCIVVRRAPNEFNESKFISLAIYNEFLLSLFLNISMLFLQSPANPDLLYIIFFCHVQLTMTLLLCLIFGSKAYLVFRGRGTNEPGDDTCGGKNRLPTSKFLNKSSSTGKTVNSSGGGFYTLNIQGLTGETGSGIERPEEFQSLVLQLKELRERHLRAGNLEIVGKIEAFQEAAERIFVLDDSPKESKKKKGCTNNHNSAAKQSPPQQSITFKGVDPSEDGIVEAKTEEPPTELSEGPQPEPSTSSGEPLPSPEAITKSEKVDKPETEEPPETSTSQKPKESETQDGDGDKKDKKKKKFTLDFNDGRFTDEITV